MKVALVHDWLVSYRGGERVLEALAQLFPEAPIYTLFCATDVLPEGLRHRHIHTPRGLNRCRRLRKLLLPWLPTAIESFDLSGYDLVISSSSCVAKGVITNPDALHISYIHSPMRYIWDQQKHYFSSAFKLPGVAAVCHYLLHKLRIWDVASSSRVDVFVANSEFVARRIQKYYRREAQVLHPPPSSYRKPSVLGLL